MAAIAASTLAKGRRRARPVAGAAGAAARRGLGPKSTLMPPSTLSRLPIKVTWPMMFMP